MRTSSAADPGWFGNRRQWLVGCLAALAAPVWAQEPVALASTEFPPYTGERLAGGGFLTRAIRLAFERSGYAPATHFYPWTRALKMTQSGEVDGITAIWRTAEREQWLAFSDPIVSNDIGFYALTERGLLVRELADVKAHGLRVGVVRGYAVPKLLLELQPQFVETLDDAAGLRMLAAKRMDLVLVDRAVAHYLLHGPLAALQSSLGWQNLVVESLPLHMALRRDSPRHAQLLAAFNTGLAAITADGTLAKLKKEYGLA